MIIEKIKKIYYKKIGVKNMIDIVVNINGEDKENLIFESLELCKRTYPESEYEYIEL